MGWFLRKAFSFGPFRLNLSKSGIGLSGGVKGARIGVRPDGSTYTHAGRYGLYHRQELGKIGGNKKSRKKWEKLDIILTESDTGEETKVGLQLPYLDDVSGVNELINECRDLAVSQNPDDSEEFLETITKSAVIKEVGKNHVRFFKALNNDQVYIDTIRNVWNVFRDMNPGLVL